MGTMVSWLALLIGLMAVGYAWKLQQELQTTTRRLDRYNRALYTANDELRQLREEVQVTKAQLRAEMVQGQPGAFAFTPATTVREAQLLHPQAAQILAAFHLGGCSSCAVEPEATLAEICQEQGRDLSQLLATLHQLRPQEAQHMTQGQPLKLPNVELAF